MIPPFTVLFAQRDGVAAPSLIASWLEEFSAIGDVDVRKELEDDIETSQLKLTWADSRL